MPLRNYIIPEPLRRQQINFNNIHALNIRNYHIYEKTFIIVKNYVIHFPRKTKRLIEFIILFMAVSSLFLLVFVHINFMQFPSSCVNQIKNNWPRDGVLQVVVHQPNNQGLSTNNENNRYKNSFFEMNNSENIDEDNNETIEKFVWEDTHGKNNMSRTNFLSYYLSPIMEANIKCTIHYDKGIFKNTIEKSNLDIVKLHFSQINKSVQCFECPLSCFNNVMSEANNNLFMQSTKYTTNTTHEQNKAMFYEDNFEYSLENGYLYLSSNSRRQLGIPVMTVLLEPSVHKMSLGSYIGVFAFNFFVNNEHFLMSTLETIASEEGKQGFMRDAIAYIAHNIFYKSSKMWFIVNFMVMCVFSLLISVSVKYIYYHFYHVTSNVIHISNVRDGTVLVSLTKVVSISFVLHGVVMIMLHFFSIDVNSYYLILLSLLADQYYVVCSRNVLTKKYWLKFFYLYQFAFYAYHSHFGGKYIKLTLTCLYLFVLHSMFYFFHHYEMSLIVADLENLEHDEEERNFVQQPRERDQVIEHMEDMEDMENIRRYEQHEEQQQQQQQQQFYMEDDQQQVVTENDDQSEDNSLIEVTPNTNPVPSPIDDDMPNNNLVSRFRMGLCQLTVPQRPMSM